MSNYSDENDNEFEEFEPTAEENAPENSPKGSGGNRTFLILLGVLGAILIFLVIGLVVLTTVILPAQKNAQAEAKSLILAQNTATVQMATAIQLTETVLALKRTPSATPAPTITVVIQPTATAQTTPETAGTTPSASTATVSTTKSAASGNGTVVAASATPTTGSGEKPGTTATSAATLSGSGSVNATATVGALLTKAAESRLTATAQGTPQPVATATALPTTGFAEDVGLPGLFGLALGLVLIIFLVRRARFAPTR